MTGMIWNVVEELPMMNFQQKFKFVKTYTSEEILPLLFILFHFFLFTGPFVSLPIIIFSCYMWTTSIYFYIVYLLWAQYDIHTLMTNGRKFHRLKNLVAFDCVRNYYPLRLIKTADLSPTKNYILAYFPHAVLPLGTMNLGYNLNNVSELFPNLDVRIVTLKILFYFPIAREYLMAAGCCTSDERNIKHLLNSKPSKGVLIIPGGVTEYSISRSGNECKIIKRKGFIRIALQTGSSVVPVFSFNEHNTQNLESFKSPIMEYINKITYKYFGMKICYVMGRGFFQKKFGLLPHRVPVTTVVGEPIPVTKVENPSPELIQEYCEKFYQALHNLFEQYKVKYDKAGSNAKLIIV